MKLYFPDSLSMQNPIYLQKQNPPNFYEVLKNSLEKEDLYLEGFFDNLVQNLSSENRLGTQETALLLQIFKKFQLSCGEIVGFLIEIHDGFQNDAKEEIVKSIFELQIEAKTNDEETFQKFITLFLLFFPIEENQSTWYNYRESFSRVIKNCNASIRNKPFLKTNKQNYTQAERRVEVLAEFFGTFLIEERLEPETNQQLVFFLISLIEHYFVQFRKYDDPYKLWKPIKNFAFIIKSYPDLQRHLLEALFSFSQNAPQELIDSPEKFLKLFCPLIRMFQIDFLWIHSLKPKMDFIIQNYEICSYELKEILNFTCNFFALFTLDPEIGLEMRKIAIRSQILFTYARESNNRKAILDLFDLIAGQMGGGDIRRLAAPYQQPSMLSVIRKSIFDYKATFKLYDYFKKNFWVDEDFSLDYFSILFLKSQSEKNLSLEKICKVLEEFNRSNIEYQKCARSLKVLLENPFFLEKSFEYFKQRDKERLTPEEIGNYYYSNYFPVIERSISLCEMDELEHRCVLNVLFSNWVQSIEREKGNFYKYEESLYEQDKKKLMPKQRKNGNLVNVPLSKRVMLRNHHRHVLDIYAKDLECYKRFLQERLCEIVDNGEHKNAKSFLATK